MVRGGDNVGRLASTDSAAGSSTNTIYPSGDKCGLTEPRFRPRFVVALYVPDMASRFRQTGTKNANASQGDLKINSDSCGKEEGGPPATNIAAPRQTRSKGGEDETDVVQANASMSKTHAAQEQQAQGQTEMSTDIPTDMEIDAIEMEIEGGQIVLVECDDTNATDP